jgi:DNA-binding response OmpR family regulator
VNTEIPYFVNRIMSGQNSTLRYVGNMTYCYPAEFELGELSKMPDAIAMHVVNRDEVPVMTKILLVDDDELIRETLTVVLESNGFDVYSAANVNEALRFIGSQTFDVLVSDLHMPGAGDGLTVIGAMRHSNPNAVTLILSSYPAMDEAATAILRQADHVLVKPLGVVMLVDIIRERLKQGKTPARVIESVAKILQDDTQATINDWLVRVDSERHILSVKMDDERRSAHLHQLFRDLVTRLSKPLPLGSRALVSPAAAQHGADRRKQGYTAAMMVEESRMLQVSIFQTLQNNLHRVNFSLVLNSVMAIADEVDSQLAQAMASYVAESKVDALPTVA